MAPARNAATRQYDVRPRAEEKIGFFHRLFNRTSRYSLTFYFLHYQLIGWPLLIVYALTGAYLIFDFWCRILKL